jgi:hypothetical protein
MIIGCNKTGSSQACSVVLTKVVGSTPPTVHFLLRVNYCIELS